MAIGCGVGVGFGGGSPAFNIPTNQWSGYVADFDSRFNVTNASGFASAFAERWSNGKSFSQATQSNQLTIANTDWGQSLVGNGTSTFMTGNTSAKSIIRNTTSITIYALAQFTHSIINGYLFDTSIGGSASSRCIIGSGNSSANLYGGNRTGDTGSAYAVSGPRAGLPYPTLMILTLDWATGAMKVYRNNVLVAQNTMGTTGSIPDTASLQTALFSASSGATGWFGGYYFRTVFCNGLHDEDTRALYGKSLYGEYGRRAPLKSSKTKTIIQLQGDSITQGNQMPAFAKDLAQQVWENLGSREDVVVLNYGRSGAKVTDGNTDRPSFIDILPEDPSYRIIYVQWYGPNDVANNLTGSTVYTNLKTGFQAARTARPGIYNVICTPIPWSGGTPTQRAELVNLRTQILTNAITDGTNAVSDLGGPGEFDVTDSNNALNSTNYVGDGLHPTEVGTGKRASVLATTLAPLLAT